MKNHDTNSVIKVAIADDHALFRTGVKTSLQSRKDIQMVAEAENEYIPFVDKFFMRRIRALIVALFVLNNLIFAANKAYIRRKCCGE